MNEREEQRYADGRRAGFRLILQECLSGLRYEPYTLKVYAKMCVEREEAISSLRQLCETHGDNDWPANLNLSDIIEKHLARHIHGG